MTLTKRVALFSFGMLFLWIGMALLEVPAELQFWQLFCGGAAFAAFVTSLSKVLE